MSPSTPETPRRKTSAGTKPGRTKPGGTKPRRKKPVREKLVIGWREWIAIPELQVERIKVKVDTGARSSSLHAFDMQSFERDGADWIRFSIHPLQDDSKLTHRVEAPLVDHRKVRPSTGEARVRPVIEAHAVLGGELWPIEITLVRRDMMGFRMLLGRQAIRGRYLVDSGHSFLAGTPSPPSDVPSVPETTVPDPSEEPTP